MTGPKWLKRNPGGLMARVDELIRRKLAKKSRKPQRKFPGAQARKRRGCQKGNPMAGARVRAKK